MHFEPPCQIILRLPGPTLLLRAAWIEVRRVNARIPPRRLPSLCTMTHFSGMSQLKPPTRSFPDDLARARKENGASQRSRPAPMKVKLVRSNHNRDEPLQVDA